MVSCKKRRAIIALITVMFSFGLGQPKIFAHPVEITQKAVDTKEQKRKADIKDFIASFTKENYTDKVDKPSEFDSIALVKYYKSYTKKVTTVEKMHVAYFLIYLLENYSGKYITPSLMQNYFDLYDKKELPSTLLGSDTDIQKWLSNDRPYDWYEDQGTTGAYSYENCGPSSAAMAVKWYNEDFKKTGADARKSYMSSGGGWSTKTIGSYLADNNVNYFYSYNPDKDVLKEFLDSGNIFLYCIDPHGLDYNYSGDSRVGRWYYYPSDGHFIIIKGYIETSKNFYLESYDPGSMGEKYSDGTPVGKNRYYAVEELHKAMEKKTPFVFVIENPKTNEEQNILR